MGRLAFFLLPLCLLAAAADDTVVFKSDVALVRVDAQVTDRDNKAITGLKVEDFVLYEGGKRQDIRNFAREEMPLDVLLLLDISRSMRPHVRKITNAAHEAFAVLGPDDRVGIMVFDTRSRLRLPLRKNRDDVERELESLLKQEKFDGGTDITRGMIDAAAYVRREGRKEARRAIVILTDDETQFDRDEQGVEAALERAGAVMSALIAPDSMAYQRGGGYPPNTRDPNDPNDPNNRGNYPPNRRRGPMGTGTGYPGGGYPGGGGVGYPGGGGSRYPGGGGNGGGRYPNGGGNAGGRTHSAGTSQIARDSGGDSMSVNDAYGLETTLKRMRQRYALHFYLPVDSRGDSRSIEVTLADGARRRYPDAEVHYRRSSQSTENAGRRDSDAPTIMRPSSPSTSSSSAPSTASDTDTSGTPRRRRGVSDGHGGPMVGPGSESAESGPQPSATAPDQQRPPLETQAEPIRPRTGWRRADDSTGSSGPKDIEAAERRAAGRDGTSTADRPAVTDTPKDAPPPDSAKPADAKSTDDAKPADTKAKDAPADADKPSTGWKRVKQN